MATMTVPQPIWSIGEYGDGYTHISWETRLPNRKKFGYTHTIADMKTPHHIEEILIDMQAIYDEWVKNGK